MGPVRTRLLREGKIKFSELVDKSTGRLRTLEDLGFTESGKPLPVPDNPTISQIERMGPTWAKHVVKENFSRKFPEWSEKPEGNLPIAVLSRRDARDIGAKGRVAVISPYTIRKQQSHHPELGIEDYLQAQVAVDKGEKLPQDEKNLAFILNVPGGRVTIVKATIDGKELYLTSLYRLSRKGFKRQEEIERLKLGRKKG